MMNFQEIRIEVLQQKSQNPSTPKAYISKSSENLASDLQQADYGFYRILAISKLIAVSLFYLNNKMNQQF